MDSPAGLKLKEIAPRDIAIIRPLWEEIMVHHQSCSLYFRPWYTRRKFEDREAELLKKSARGKIRIMGASEADTDLLVGYCVSTISDQGLGEIDSLAVSRSYRSHGIGSELVRDALTWLTLNKASPIIVQTAVGNERAYSFYERHGFLPRQILFQLPGD